MKKFIVACAVVLGAGLFASCGDTNFCYEVTTTYSLLGVETTTVDYFWGTSNELKAYEADIKAGLKQLGLSEDAIKMSSKRTAKSQDDCHK